MFLSDNITSELEKVNKIILILLPFIDNTDMTKSEIIHLLKDIKTQFGDDYSYFVKAHPRSKVEQYIPHDMHIIPSNISIESVLMAFKEKIHALVGQDTSTFLYVPEGIKSWMIHEPKVEPFTTWQQSGFKTFSILEKK